MATGWRHEELMMVQTAILAGAGVFGGAVAIACREDVILAELDPWWPEINDRFGVTLRSANDDYRLASRAT